VLICVEFAIRYGREQGGSQHLELLLSTCTLVTLSFDWLATTANCKRSNNYVYLSTRARRERIIQWRTSLCAIFPGSGARLRFFLPRMPTNQMSLGELRYERAPSAPKQKLCTCRQLSMVSVRLCRFLTPLTAPGRSSAACAAAVAVAVWSGAQATPNPGMEWGLRARLKADCICRCEAGSWWWTRTWSVFAQNHKSFSLSVWRFGLCTIWIWMSYAV